MKINVGQHYYLQISSDIENIPCPWASNPNSRLYPVYSIWKELHDETVLVKDKTKMLVNYAVVELVDGPYEEFAVPERCLLEITARLPRTHCICNIQALMRAGCKCGAISSQP